MRQADQQKPELRGRVPLHNSSPFPWQVGGVFVGRDEPLCPAGVGGALLHHHQPDWRLGVCRDLGSIFLARILPSAVIEHAGYQENQKQNNITSYQNDEIQGNGINLQIKLHLVPYYRVQTRRMKFHMHK